MLAITGSLGYRFQHYIVWFIKVKSWHQLFLPFLRLNRWRLGYLVGVVEESFSITFRFRMGLGLSRKKLSWHLLIHATVLSRGAVDIVFESILLGAQIDILLG
jgi:hypothetical protein